VGLSKTSQLQVRVSAAEKARIRRAAKHAGMGMSEWVLSKVLPQAQAEFQEIVQRLRAATRPSFVFAELNDFLTLRTREELVSALAVAPTTKLSPYLSNYVAAMVELSAHKRGFPIPQWIHDVPALDSPSFGVEYTSLRLHLLLESPPPFRRRNIFIDASIGERV